ncbi:MAG TPA: glycosyltransferase [Anaerolineales bacterium]|nr:glycosyltransferase [Anaerolineales bacterium]
MMIWVWAFVSGVLLVITLVAVLNTLTFPRLQSTVDWIGPSVSILVPARDEGRQIGNTIRRLLAQDYQNYEIIVLDDQSSDDTFEIAIEAGAGDTSLRVEKGQVLPTGWTGKNWACHQLAGYARGDILVYTDADVHWEPGALRALVSNMLNHQADMLTIWPTQRTITWGERLVVPLMMLSILGYLPETLVRFTRWSAFSAANGQCLAFWRETYDRTGGHAALKGSLLDDVDLARLTKKTGLRLVMVLGEELISARMYSGWRQVRYGFAKNILTGHGSRPMLLFISTLFHWLVFIGPWTWLSLGWALPLGTGWPWLPLLLTILSLTPRLITAAISRQRLMDGLLMPVSVILMSLISCQSIWWHLHHGGPEWKGRRIQAANTAPGK